MASPQDNRLICVACLEKSGILDNMRLKQPKLIVTPETILKQSS
jgi:hypothetical protein